MAAAPDAVRTVQIRAELDTPMVVLRPGDTLVIGCQQRLTMAEAVARRQRIAEMLPGVEAVFIDGADYLAAYRPAALPDVTSRPQLPGDRA